MAAINGSIIVSIQDRRCFDVSATIISTTASAEKRHEVPRKKIVLKP
jgi:hypothetical protein